MIVEDEDNVTVRNKLQQSTILNNYIKNNKQIDCEDFYEFCSECIEEMYGKLDYYNFRSNSHAAPWFLQKQNIIRNILREHKVKIYSPPVEVRPQLSYTEWCLKYLTE